MVLFSLLFLFLRKQQQQLSFILFNLLILLQILINPIFG